MSNYDLIAFDMDDTLLNRAKQITPKTTEQLKRASEAGKITAICSGRGPGEVTEFSEAHPELRYMIGMNGAGLFDAKDGFKPISGRPIPADLLRKCLDECAKFDVMIEYMAWRPIMDRKFLDCCADYHMGQYKEHYIRNLNICDDPEGFIFGTGEQVYSLLVLFRDIPKRDAAKEILCKLPMTVTNAEYSGVAITMPGVNKGEGLKLLCNYLNIDIERTIGVGDAGNDVPLLKTAGLGVAVGNADAEARAAAQVIVADCDHDGCAEAIDRYLM